MTRTAEQWDRMTKHIDPMDAYRADRVFRAVDDATGAQIIQFVGKAVRTYGMKREEMDRGLEALASLYSLKTDDLVAFWLVATNDF